MPDGPVAVEFDDVRFAYPSADKVSLASLEEVATLDTRGGVEVLHGVSFRAEPGQTGRAGRLVGRREVDHRRAACRGCTTSTPAPSGSAASTCAT